MQGLLDIYLTIVSVTNQCRTIKIKRRFMSYTYSYAIALEIVLDIDIIKRI